LVPENGDQCDPVVHLVLAFLRRQSLSFMGVQGPLYAWLVRGIPALFVALGSLMLIKQFQPYRYQGYGKAAGNPALSARKILSWTLMILRTVEQVRRIFLILAGFTLLLLGIIMIFTPGPGTPVILMGLGLLAAEFVWARRIVDRIKRESARLKDMLLPPEK
jgi:Putative transmembrane protein (PGPGW)